MFGQAADFSAFRTRAAQQQRNLEAQVADARQDRAAAVAVIEGLQRELREARCECAALVDQRRYFEEHALAASANSQQALPSHSGSGAHAGAPEAVTGEPVRLLCLLLPTNLLPSLLSSARVIPPMWIRRTRLVSFQAVRECCAAGPGTVRATTGSYGWRWVASGPPCTGH